MVIGEVETVRRRPHRHELGTVLCHIDITIKGFF